MIVGITGHRKLASPADVSASIRTVLERLLEITRVQGEPLVLFSPLAEGADRLAVRASLEFDDIEFRALLPLPQDDYRRDFRSTESLGEFETLLKRADDVETLPEGLLRPEAYLAVGQELVRRCDLILAIWDGCPAKGQGGTGEIVAIARSQGRPLIWINSQEPDALVWERTGGLLPRT